jgi:hypothetical protein
LTLKKNHMNMWINIGGHVMGFRALLIAIVLVSVGCMSGGPMPWAGDPQPAPNYAQRPASPQATRAAQEQQAEDILHRAQAVRLAADAAVQLDGTPQTAQTRQVARGCHGGHDACFTAIKTLGPRSATGAAAGLADYLVDPVGSYIFAHVEHGTPLPMDLRPILKIGPDLDLAEKAASQATDEAQKVADARAAAQQGHNAEMASIEAAGTACTPSGTCAARCASGDGPSCVVHATKLWRSTPPKLAEARAAMQAGCDAGLQTACTGVSQIDGDIQQARMTVESLWSGVTDAGDDLATKMHMVTVAQQVGTPRLRMNLPAMQAINAAIVVERYCPSVKAFLAVSSAVDFAKRAAAHCKTEAPTATGLSGAQVTLTAECQQVYGTACP